MGSTERGTEAFGVIRRVGWMNYCYAALQGLACSWLGFLQVTCENSAGAGRSLYLALIGDLGFFV